MQVFFDNPWFASLPAEDAQALLDAGRILKLARGACIFRQGEVPADSAGTFFGVASGVVRLSMLHAGGNETILAIMEPGNWFGFTSQLNGLPRSHSTIAHTDVELLAVSAPAFQNLMQRLGFAQGMVRLLAGRLRLAYGMTADQALSSTRERVARRLAFLVNGDMALSTSRSNIIDTSQDTLAMMLGITRPTLNKELQWLASRGAIALHYGRIEIKDLQLLLADFD